MPDFKTAAHNYVKDIKTSFMEKPVETANKPNLNHLSTVGTGCNNVVLFHY